MREVRCYVEWCATLGMPRGNSLGTIATPKQLHKLGTTTQGERLIWLLDMDAAMRQLADNEQTMLLWAGMGHSLKCCATGLGVSDRTAVRRFAEATDALEQALQQQQEPVTARRGIVWTRIPKRERIALTEPSTCECHGLLSGRPKAGTSEQQRQRREVYAQMRRESRRQQVAQA